MTLLSMSSGVRRHQPVLLRRVRPLDDRAGRNPAFDARRSAGNTNDLRGKLLRIRVKPGGGYTVPRGNLFAPGTPARPGPRSTRWACATRSGSRSTAKSDNVYLGDYSPDAQEANPPAGRPGTAGGC